MATSFRAIGAVIITSICTAIGQVFFKYGSATVTFDPLSLLLNGNLWMGGLFYCLGLLLLLWAFRHGELSVLFPFVALSYVWVSLLSILLFKETMVTVQWIGIVSIVAGMFFIAKGGTA